MKNLFFRIALLFALGLVLVNCEDGEIGPPGADGIDGIDGQNGIDGQDGQNGQDGEDGENGVGFDELARFGSLTLTIEGILPNDIPFTDTEVFKFIDPEEIPVANSVIPLATGLRFNTKRFLSTTDEFAQKSSVRILMDVIDPDATIPTFENFQIKVDDIAIFFDDATFLGIVFDSNESEIFNLNISDFNFNSETNHLIFSFSFTVNEEDNFTNNPLVVSGTADVFVLEEIRPIR